VTAAAAELKPSAQLVYALLEAHPEGVTALEALRAGAGDSLAQRVHELRSAGADIADEYEATPNGQRVKRYRLAERYAGHPVTAARPCPACRRQHPAGRTCAWTSRDVPQGAGSSPRPGPLPSAAAAAGA
jgi:hypothetical protein